MSEVKSNTVTIRTCSLQDADVLMSLGIQTFRETFEEVNTRENMKVYLETNFTKARLSNELSEAGAVFFIAEINGEPAGFSKVIASKKPADLDGHSAMEIERIYATKKHIGMGVGKSLMQTCLNHAKKNGHDVLWLGVWEHNIRAIDFYKKWGFEKFSQHVFMLGHDAQTDILMKKYI
jgi:ribosomal protein S18 acetylase RimI-like enzyme